MTDSRRPGTCIALARTFMAGFAAWAALCLPALAQVDTRIVERPAVTPRQVSANQPTAVLVTVRVAPSPSLIPGSVTLVRYDEAGKAIGTLGRMTDDGQNGDALVGDGVYSLRIQVTEANPQAMKLRVSVAYKGALVRTTSEVVTLFVQATATAEQTITTLAGLIATGDTDGALRYFTGSAKNRDVLASLNAEQRTSLVAAFMQAVLLRADTNTRVYVAPLAVDGAVLQREFSMSRTMLNEWYVMSW